MLRHRGMPARFVFARQLQTWHKVGLALLHGMQKLCVAGFVCFRNVQSGHGVGLCFHEHAVSGVLGSAAVSGWAVRCSSGHWTLGRGAWHFFALVRLRPGRGK
jgi:hypothetical protein